MVEREERNEGERRPNGKKDITTNYKAA